MRILLAGLLGGVVMYVFLSVAHLSPLGQIGVHALPNGETMIADIAHAAGGKAGLYFLPDHMSKPPSAPKGPFALISFAPSASTTLSPRQLVFEFLGELAETILAAWLLAQAGLRAYGARVAFVTVIGAVGAILAEAPYWNWYSFPLDYSLINAAMQIVGFFVAGLAMAALLRPAKA